VGPDFTTFEIEIERHLTGYEAGDFQTYYYLYNDAKREQTEEDLLDVLNDNSAVKMLSLLNADPEDAFVKPLIIKGKVTELHIPLIEFAGDLMIFKLGYLFGEYTSLKEIDKKKTDFVFSNPFIASTTINVVFSQNVNISAAQEIPQSADLCPSSDIRISSDLKIQQNAFSYTHASQFDKNRYSIETKDIMTDVFVFWNSLHKMNLIIEKKP